MCMYTLLIHTLKKGLKGAYQNVIGIRIITWTCQVFHN